MLHHHVDFTHHGSTSDLVTTKATPCRAEDARLNRGGSDQAGG